MKELNEKQIKGVDISVKATSRKFPFIKSWGLVDDYTHYKSNLYIDLYVDWFLLKEYYNFKWNSYYVNTDLSDVRTNTVGILFEPSYDLNSVKFDEKLEKSRLIKQKIEVNINNIYVNLPSEFQEIWDSEYGNKKFIVNIGISEFLTFS